MSHNSLHIQEISSRTFNNDPSMMETSIQHFERPNHSNPQKFDSKMILNKTVNASSQELKSENESFRKEIAAYRNHILELQRSEGGAFTQEGYVLEILQEGARKDAEFRELNKNYQKAIGNLKETMDKNGMLSREVARLSKKLKDSELNYSREKEVLQKSQNLISNLSITKSNYEIELVNMQDSLIILEKERNKITETNEQYEEKLALISQEIERLRNVLEKCKKENEMLKFHLDDAGLKVKKYQSETVEQKSILQRLRTENRELNSKYSALALQLREHHEKLAYKETIINDSKETRAVMERSLKEKDLYIKNLDAKLEEIERSWKAREEEFSRQANNYAQELGKVRSKLSEQNSSNKQILMQREVLVSEQQEILQRYGLLKDELERKAYQTHALVEQLKSVEKERDMHMREREALLAENEQLGNHKGELLGELQKMKNELLRWQEKYQDTEVTFRKYEEKERLIIREYQSKLDTTNQQRNSELSAKNSEINQYKYELSARVQEIERLKNQISGLSAAAEQEKRRLEEQLRQKNQEISEAKVKLSNSEKLLEQSRRERDLLLQEKTSITKSTQKIEQIVQTKNTQLRNSSFRMEELGRTVREISEQSMRQTAEIESYKRVMADNERAIAGLSDKARESNLTIQHLSAELERTAGLIKEKEAVIQDLSSHLREHLSASAEKQNEISSLKASNERVSAALGRAEEYKSNFQVFLQEIERLNQIVAGKQSEVKQLRLELSQLVQKIDGIGQEQLKIINAIEAANSQEVNQSQEIRIQFNDLKQYIGRINQNTTKNLKDLYEQSTSITTHLSRNEVEHQKTQNELQSRLSEASRALMIKENDNNLLLEQINVLKDKLARQEQGLVKQEEIFVKILELSRENSSVKEKLAHFTAERDLELASKNSSIANFESQISQLDKMQKKEVGQLKLYIKEKEKRMEEQQNRSLEEVGGLKSQLKRVEQTILQKEKVIEELRLSLQNVTPMIDSKMRELQVISRELQINSFELQRYKQMFSDKHQRGRESSQLAGVKREAEALTKIISLREQQLSQNQEAYINLQNEVADLRQILAEQKSLSREQIIESQLQIQQLGQEKIELYERLKEAEESLAYLERLHSQRGEGNSAQLRNLLQRNLGLEKEMKILNGKLRQNQSKLADAKEQIGSLSSQLYEFIESQNRSIDKLESAGLIHRQKQELLKRVDQLEEELQSRKGEANELRIENEYLRESFEQSKSFLHSYQFKTAEVDKEYVSLKEVYRKLTQEYSRLQLKNHEFEIELSKAEVLQQKIQALNGEINRLSKERIELTEEVSSCKLALSSEVMVERRIQEQFLLIVLLMAEVESLRSRLATQEMEIKSSRIAQLSPYRQ